MIPIDQENFGEGAGNCFCAVVASLLEVGLYNVPSYSDGNWWGQWNRWLLEHHQVQLVMVGGPRVHLGAIPADRVLRIVAGPSPRLGLHGDGTRIHHSVIYEGRRMVHDPHPSRDGVENIAYLIEMGPANGVAA